MSCDLLFTEKSKIENSNTKKVVFVKDKLFQARSVDLGITVDHLTLVISGIDENTEIAQNAQYLTDSESFVKVKH